MRVVEIPFGSLGLDTDTKLTRANCDDFVAQGYVFVVRYLSLGPQSARDLSPGERDDILASGLGLVLVQHVRYEGWTPAAAMGQSDGERAVANARELNAPQLAPIWCDMEGSIGGDPQGYVNAWAHAVAMNVGYGVDTIRAFDPGIYVGAGCGMSGTQLYGLALHRYWRSASLVPELPKRGYQMMQLFHPPLGSTTICGVACDVNAVQYDHDATLPTMVVAD